MLPVWERGELRGNHVRAVGIGPATAGQISLTYDSLVYAYCSAWLLANKGFKNVRAIGIAVGCPTIAILPPDCDLRRPLNPKFSWGGMAGYGPVLYGLLSTQYQNCPLESVLNC